MTAVQPAIERAAHQRTMIAITHRLSTIQNSHWISVLGGGRVFKQVKYDLMRLRGRNPLLAQATGPSSGYMIEIKT